jgi:peptidoglycan/LPS O-acetylase OafA/YrhL
MTSARQARIRYVVAGLLIAGFWYLNRNRSPWEDALRTIGIFTVLMVVMRVRLKRKSVDVHLVLLIAAKAVLIVIAVLVQEALKHWMDNPALVVAVGLGFVVALLGPLGDHRFFTPAIPSPTRTISKSAQ